MDIEYIMRLGGWENLDMVVRYTRSVKFEESLRIWMCGWVWSDVCEAVLLWEVVTHNFSSFDDPTIYLNITLKAFVTLYQGLMSY